MTTDDLQRLERRVARAAEAALAEGKFVTPIDVLVGVGWLPPRRVLLRARAAVHRRSESLVLDAVCEWFARAR